MRKYILLAVVSVFLLLPMRTVSAAPGTEGVLRLRRQDQSIIYTPHDAPDSASEPDLPSHVYNDDTDLIQPVIYFNEVRANLPDAVYAYQTDDIPLYSYADRPAQPERAGGESDVLTTHMLP